MYSRSIDISAWENFEELLADVNVYPEEETAVMGKRVDDVLLDVYRIADRLSDVFREDRQRGIRIVAGELRKDIEKLQSLGDEEITKRLDHIHKLTKRLDHIHRLVNVA